ncbi:MAG: hypothetical protein ABIW17_07945 [Marmoricola sp.]
MSEKPGIETAQYEVAEVTHDVESLTGLFKGASVVCDTVGPFSRYGPEVVEAASTPACATSTPRARRTG